MITPPAATAQALKINWTNPVRNDHHVVSSTNPSHRFPHKREEAVREKVAGQIQEQEHSQRTRPRKGQGQSGQAQNG